VSQNGAELAAGVRYRFTGRPGGQSRAPYESLNLGPAVGDDPASVAANRKLVAASCGLEPPGIAWMRQVHGTRVRYAGPSWPDLEPEPCDGVYTDAPGLALGVLVADCVPVLLADPEARLAGAAHAGREGMVAGVVPAMIGAMTAAGARPARIVAMIGPSICGGCYEVPESMRARVSAEVPAAYCQTRAGRHSRRRPGPARRRGCCGDRARCPVHQRIGGALLLPPRWHHRQVRRAGLAHCLTGCGRMPCGCGALRCGVVPVRLPGCGGSLSPGLRPSGPAGMM